MEKRKKYDFQQSMGNRNGWYSPFSGFGDNIWGGFGRQEPQKEVGGDIYVNLNVSLQDIYKQKHIEFKYNKRVPCNHCNGTGAENGKLNYWTGRDFLGYDKRQKYFTPQVERKDIIFNEEKIQWDADVTLVEGPFDHIVVPNSIPLLGKVLKTDFKIYQEII